MSLDKSGFEEFLQWHKVWELYRAAAAVNNHLNICEVVKRDLDVHKQLQKALAAFGKAPTPPTRKLPSREDGVGAWLGAVDCFVQANPFERAVLVEHAKGFGWDKAHQTTFLQEIINDDSVDVPAVTTTVGLSFNLFTKPGHCYLVCFWDPTSHVADTKAVGNWVLNLQGRKALVRHPDTFVKWLQKTGDKNAE